MELYKTILSLAIVLSTSAQYVHEAYQYRACSATDEEYFIGFDKEEVWHVDFKQKKGVGTIPEIAGKITYPGLYEIGVDAVVGCKHDLPLFAKIFKSLPLGNDDAPQTSIFTKTFVQLGVQNTLICHVTDFFPPSVNISWTKNNVIMTEDISLSQYRPKADGTFNIFSTLKFTPAQGDIYSCTVHHRALQGQPQTKIWDVEVALPSIAPSVFCGVGLSLGLLGVAIGTFFLIKGSNFN